MAILKNITTTPSASGEVLIDPDNYSSNVSSINISSIMISNNAAAEVAIDVFILDTAPESDVYYYLCKNLVIPTGVSLVLDGDFSFHIKSTRTLKIYTADVSPNLTVIIN